MGATYSCKMSVVWSHTNFDSCFSLSDSVYDYVSFLESVEPIVAGNV